MVNKTSSSTVRILKIGYTLVELVVVLGLIAFMGTLTIFGFSNQNKDQRVLAAQREIIVGLRSIQTKVDSGVGGSNFKTARFANGDSFYTLDGVVVNLTPGVTLSVSPSPVKIFFSHPSLSGLALCGGVAVYFACVNGTPDVVYYGQAGFTKVTIGFSGSARSVKIEGSGMNVNRIYE